MCHALYTGFLGDGPPDSLHGLWASMLAIILGLQTTIRSASWHVCSTYDRRASARGGGALAERG